MTKPLTLAEIEREAEHAVLWRENESWRECKAVAERYEAMFDIITTDGRACPCETFREQDGKNGEALKSLPCFSTGEFILCDRKTRGRGDADREKARGCWRLHYDHRVTEGLE